MKDVRKKQTKTIRTIARRKKICTQFWFFDPGCQGNAGLFREIRCANLCRDRGADRFSTVDDKCNAGYRFLPSTILKNNTDYLHSVNSLVIPLPWWEQILATVSDPFSPEPVSHPSDTRERSVCASQPDAVVEKCIQAVIWAASETGVVYRLDTSLSPKDTFHPVVWALSLSQLQ